MKGTLLFSHKTIVVATDFLESSRLALDYAVGFAQHYDAKIILFHCVELSQAALEIEMEGRRSLTRGAAEERLEALTKSVSRTGLWAEWKLCAGVPSDALLQWIRSINVDLLVLGTHGIHRGLSHLLVGSNTERIMSEVPCPTLTVGRHVMTMIDLNLRFDEIMYISDFTPESLAAATYASELHHEFNTDVSVFQLAGNGAHQDIQDESKDLADYREMLRKAVPEDDFARFSSELRTDRTNAVDEILKRAQSCHSGLIVLGIRTQSWFARHFSTSLAYQLLSRSTCPILTVHAPSAERRE